MKNWISNYLKPKIKSLFKKRSSESNENLWTTCECKNLILKEDLMKNLNVCPKCNAHHKLTCPERFKIFFDNGEYELLDYPVPYPDPLKFFDKKKYSDRIKEARKLTGQNDAVAIATGKLDGMDVTVGAQDFRFNGGSFSMASAEAFLYATKHAIEKKQPFIFFSCTGGIAVQQNLFSLNGMIRSTIAVRDLRKNKIPFVSVLTNPTSGGAFASYASLGDFLIGEEDSIICFAGLRVIQAQIKESLPEDFQKASWVEAHGQIDLVVKRKYMRSTISTLLNVLLKTAETKANTDSTNVVSIDQSLQKSYKTV